MILQENVVVIGWQELPDLAGVQSREALEALYRDVYTDTKPQKP
jgi:predicted Mrr-cat superfamily restriction endonuclease